MRKIFALLFVLVLFLTDGMTQTMPPVKISRQYVNKPLVDVLHDLQTAYAVNFYYINQEVEHVTITKEIKDQPVQQALKIIFSGTDLDFNMQSPGRYVIFRRNAPLSKPARPEKKPILNDTIRPKDTINRFRSELPAVEVTPGSYDIRLTGQSPLSLTKKEILYSPNLAKDITRTLRVLPGVASNDFSAKPRIRGGNADETAVYLDNFEILEAYHFDELDGTFCIINTDYVNSVKVIPGGFSANYTDKLSGIIDIKAPNKVDSSQVGFSFDLVNATVFLKQKINSKSDFQFSARRTYLDFLLSSEGNNDSKIKPVYYDIWGKFNYRINNSNLLSFNFLYAIDHIKIDTKEGYFNWFNYNGDKNNAYFWTTWRNISPGNFRQTTTLGYQRLSKKADFSFNNSISAGNQDVRKNNILVLTHNSYLQAGLKNNIEFGGELKYFSSHIRFNEIRYNETASEKDSLITDSIHVNGRPTATTGAIFLQNTVSLTDNFTITGGIRLSYFSTLKKPLLLSPRLAISYRVNKNIILKAGYGVYNQATYITNTKTFEGQQEPPDQGKQSIQYVANITYTAGDNTIQVNAYYKNNRKLFEDYRYDVFNRVGGAIAILDKDFLTNSGYSRGIEFTGRHAYGNKNIVTVSYAYAINKIKSNAGEETWRDNDRRHTFIINNLLNLGRNWTFGAFSLFFTGEPYTPTKVKFIGSNGNHEVLYYSFDKKNSKRLPGFFTLDVKLDKYWYFKKWGLNVYLNIINLTSHKNIRNYYWITENHGSLVLPVETRELYLSNFFISPGIGVSL